MEALRRNRIRTGIRELGVCRFSLIVSSKENLEVLSNAFACRVLKESLIEKKKKKNKKIKK